MAFNLEEYSRELFQLVARYSEEHVGVPIHDLRNLDQSAVAATDWGDMDSVVHEQEENLTPFFSPERQRIYMVGGEYPTNTELLGVTLHELGHAHQHADQFPQKLIDYLEQSGRVEPGVLNREEPWSNYEKSAIFRLVIERQAWDEAFRIRQGLGIEAPAMQGVFQRAMLRDSAAFEVGTGLKAAEVLGPIMADYANGGFNYVPRSIPERTPSDADLCPKLKQLSDKVEVLISRRYLLKESSKSLLYPLISAEHEINRLQQLKETWRQMEGLRRLAQNPEAGPEQATAALELTALEKEHARGWRWATGSEEFSQTVLEQAITKASANYAEAHEQGGAILEELRELYRRAQSLSHEPISPEREKALNSVDRER